MSEIWSAMLQQEGAQATATTSSPTTSMIATCSSDIFNVFGPFTSLDAADRSDRSNMLLAYQWNMPVILIVFSTMCAAAAWFVGQTMNTLLLVNDCKHSACFLVLRLDVHVRLVGVCACVCDIRFNTN